MAACRHRFNGNIEVSKHAPGLQICEGHGENQQSSSHSMTKQAGTSRCAPARRRPNSSATWSALPATTQRQAKDWPRAGGRFQGAKLEKIHQGRQSTLLHNDNCLQRGPLAGATCRLHRKRRPPGTHSNQPAQAAASHRGASSHAKERGAHKERCAGL